MVDCRMSRVGARTVQVGLARMAVRRMLGRRILVRRILVRGAVLAVLLVLVAGVQVWEASVGTRVAAAQSAMPAPGIEMTTLATRRLEEVPPGRRWVLRRGHPLNEDAHAHAGGFIYAASGSTYLVVEDSQGYLMQEGQAGWAPEGIGH